MKSTDTSTSRDLASIIQAGRQGRRGKSRWLIPATTLFIVVVAWLFWSNRAGARGNQPAYVTEPLRRGDISLTITATGNLEPTNEVTVGSELSGTIVEVHVDTNERVTRGQPLARLDTSKFSQQTESARAALASAKAARAQAQATQKESSAALDRQLELQRLSGGKVPSKADIDAATAAADRAAANLASAEAAVAEAEAQVRISESDLGKAVIKSPIDGIVLTRSVEPGQTVAASLAAPELFVIAENLEHMRLQVAIAEADIARVSGGQQATFTVDAWPGRTYDASVLKVSFGSSVTDNVVTYETELEVENQDLSLRPGMTATADIRVAESKGVFLVPTAALRFDPEPSAASGSAAAAPANRSFVQSLTPMPPRPGRRPAGEAKEEKIPGTPGTARIWVLRDGRPEAVVVRSGLSDGRFTEVSAEALAENLPVITRAVTPSGS